jgi:hypothetical protein
MRFILKAVPIYIALISCLCASAQNVDDKLELQKLKFLSCNSFKNDPQASNPKLTEWGKNLFLSYAKKTDSGYDKGAPIEIKEKFLLNNACIENIKVFLGPEAMVVQGEICNEDLAIFKSALGSIGINLKEGSVFLENELPVKTQNKIISSSKDDTRTLYRSYFIADGGIDFPSWEPKPTRNKFTYWCER